MKTIRLYATQTIFGIMENVKHAHPDILERTVLNDALILTMVNCARKCVFVMLQIVIMSLDVKEIIQRLRQQQGSSNQMYHQRKKNPNIQQLKRNYMKSKKNPNTQHLKRNYMITKVT
ncbi:uncharacterized protein [Magallana gigas]|uniref:uncharacterized protein n=1 Tax=Magallana gigas TaxID=29159 RepID=UPI00333F40A2